MRIGRVRATRIAAIVGQVIAVLFIVFGLWTQQLMLALIGFFVFTTARMELVRYRDCEGIIAHTLLRRSWQFANLHNPNV